MAATQNHQQSSAEAEQALWKARAGDFTVFERRMLGLYESALDDLLIYDRTTLLDIGCRAGFFLRLAAQRGATVAGVDATASLVEIARERLPGADLTIGENGALPYDDDTFTIVTAFDSFQAATDPVGAVGEARRVARPRAPVLLATWGRLGQCEAAAYVSTLIAMGPPPAPSALGPFALAENGALEAFAADGGLSPLERRDVFCVWSFPDQATALRALQSTSYAVRATAQTDDEQVAAAILAAIAPFRLSNGGYRLENTFTYLMAQA